MRAWLLLLAVLATSHHIVQVASTEDIITRGGNSASISTLSLSSADSETSRRHHYEQQQQQQDQQKNHRKSNQNNNNNNNNKSAVKRIAVTPAAKSPFHISSATKQSFVSESIAKSVKSISTALQSFPMVASSLSPALIYESDINMNSDSENNNNNNNNNKNNRRAQNMHIRKQHKQHEVNNKHSDVIIEIKNFEEYDGKDSMQRHEAFHNVAALSSDLPQVIHAMATTDKEIETEMTAQRRTEQQLENASNEESQIKSNQNTNNKNTDINININTNTNTNTNTISLNEQATNSAVSHQQQQLLLDQVPRENRSQSNSMKFASESGLSTLSSSSSSSSLAAMSTSSSSATSSSSSSATSSSSSNHNADANEIDINIDDEFDNIDFEEEGEDTYSNKKKIAAKLKPDPSTLVQIENSLLSLFNMKRPPKIDRSKIVIPEAMKQLYAEIMGHELETVHIPKTKGGLLTKSANTVRSFTHQDSKIDERFPHHHRFRLYFDINTIPNEEKLKAAELQLSRDTINAALLHPHQASRTRYQLLVYDITRIGMRGKREPSYLLLDTKTVRLNSTEPVTLDVQPAVDRWLATPKKNFGLLVEVRTMRSLKPAPHHHIRLRRSLNESHENWQHIQPLLLTYTDDGRHKARKVRDLSTRSKRAGHRTRPHRRKNNEENCRRHLLYVDFDDVGWSDWIVAPPGYDAYYCHGKCSFPLAEHLNSTNHAVVQTLVNNINPGKVPKACCVPTQLDGITMLYLNDQRTVVLKNYQDMTVVGCGCR